MKNDLFGGDVPMGLGMALAQNVKALERFSSMTEKERKRLVAGTHDIHSSREMQLYVQNIAEGNI